MWKQYPLEEIDPVILRRAQRRFRNVATAMFTAGALIMAASAFLAANMPYSSDTYNLVYSAVRPEKPEDTYVFLFVFPGFLLMGSLILWFDPFAQLQKMCKHDGMSILIVLWNSILGGVFALIAISRDVAVWNYYF